MRDAAHWMCCLLQVISITQHDTFQLIYRLCILAIKKSKSGSLANKLYAFIGVIKKAVKDVRHDGRKFDMHDYPAMVVGCEYDQRVEECGRSSKAHKVFKERVPRVDHLNYRIVNALQALNPNIKIPCCDENPKTGEIRFYGTCAEDDAASKVLNRLDQTRQANPKLSHLKFTPARRPRTGSKKPYCVICKQVFG